MPAVHAFAILLQDVIPEDKQPELLGTISKGNITMRVLRDIFDSFVNMGPLSQVGSQVGVCVWGGGGIANFEEGWLHKRGTISKGNITMKVLRRDIIDSFVNMGPLSQVREAFRLAPFPSGWCVWWDASWWWRGAGRGGVRAVQCFTALQVHCNLFVRGLHR